MNREAGLYQDKVNTNFQILTPFVSLLLCLSISFIFVGGRNEDSHFNLFYWFYTSVTSVSLLLLMFLVTKWINKWVILSEQNKDNKKPGCFTVTKEEYEITAKKSTKEEKKKLFQDVRFQQMIETKGCDENNWNWQKRDRANGSMNVISDDDLSQVSCENGGKYHADDYHREWIFKED